MIQASSQEIAKWLLAKIGKHKKSGGSYQFRCPAHEDKAASGSLKVYQDGVGLKCFASCTTDEICAALGIQKSDLFVSGGGIRRSRILRSYSYFDDEGRLLCQHHRMIQGSKTDAKFLWQRFDEAGNAIWSLGHGWFELCGQNWRRIKKATNGKDVDHDDPQTSPKLGARWFDDASARPLYHQSRLKDAAPGEMVLEQEGEKDVETAEAWGFYSTTPGSAKDWKPYHAEALAGFYVVIICDNDAPGRAAGLQKARDCYGKAARVKVIECLPGVKDKGDLTDWVAMGHTRGELLTLIEATPDYVPTGEAIEDESTTVEVEIDDAPISEDPKTEKYLRQVARNAAKLNDAVDLIVRKLGFQGDHSRLLVKLASIAPDKLGTISCCHTWLAAKYGMSISTVARDIHKLVDEQEHIGVELIGYTEGTYNPQAGVGYASKFRRNYLRWALAAIGIAFESRGDQEYSHDALNRACDEVVRGIERLPVDRSAKMNSEADGRAEKRASDSPNLEAVKLKHKAALTAYLKRRVCAMGLDGLSLEDALELVSECVNDATVYAVTHTEGMLAEDAGGFITQDDNYIETIEGSKILSLSSNIDGQQDGVSGAGSSSAYGQQDDDHRRSDEDPEIVTESHVSAFSLVCEADQGQDRAAEQGNAPLFCASAPIDEISARSGNWQNSLLMKARLAYEKAETRGNGEEYRD